MSFLMSAASGAGRDEEVDTSVAVVGEGEASKGHAHV
jgi:hypothetical protein